MAKIDLQNRAPSVIVEFDFRLTVIRRYDVLNYLPKKPDEFLAEIELPLGSVDELYTNCYLVEQKLEGQTGPYRAPCVEPPILYRKFTQLDGRNETQVGNPGITFDQYGNKIVTIEWLQLADGSPTYQTVGGTPAPVPNQTAILQTEERTNDGTLARIKRVYITAGELSTSNTLSYDGKLSVITIKSLNEIPTTPAGYTITGTNVEYVNGLPVYTYTFAKGEGQISEEVTYQQSDDNGVTGVTVTTIRYLTDPSVDSNPITPPSGAATVSTGYQDQDGFRL